MNSAFDKGFRKTAGVIGKVLRYGVPTAAGAAGVIYGGSQLSPEFDQATTALGKDLRRKWLDFAHPLAPNPNLAAAPTAAAAASVTDAVTKPAPVAAPQGPSVIARKSVAKVAPAPAPAPAPLPAPGPAPRSDVYNTADIRNHLNSQGAQDRQAVVDRQEATGRRLSPTPVQQQVSPQPAGDEPVSRVVRSQTGMSPEDYARVKARQQSQMDQWRQDAARFGK